jgi:hypothetical protein
MKKGFSLLITLATSVFALNAQNTEIPSELKPFVKQGYNVLDFAKEDMNADGRPDYILILKTTKEDTMSFDNPDWDASRPLLLIIRQSNGTLKSVANNSELILCRQCGGVMGDPYQGINTKPGEFTVDFYGGSSWRWSASYTFVYDKVKKNWFMQTHASSYFQSGDPETTMEESTINRDEAGDISLQNFSPYYNADSSSWKVNAAKTWFYASPELKTEPKKAYLVKGDNIVSVKNFKNFIECNYTNSKGTITSGYILKKDLTILQSRKPKAMQ